MGKKDRHTDRLVVIGVNSKGFGTFPKVLSKDRRVTPEAKGIYGYISSYAGSGTTAFPGLELILYDMGMTAKRFYSHFNLLTEYGYITVTKERNTGKVEEDNSKKKAKKGTWGHCIYTLNTEIPNPYVGDTPLSQNDQVDSQDSPRTEDTPLSQNDQVENSPLGRYPQVDNDQVNINSLNNIDTPTFSTFPSTITNSIVSPSVRQSVETATTVDGQMDGPEQVFNNIDWEYLKKQKLDPYFIDDAQRTITVLWYTSEYVTDGAKLPQKVIRNFLLQLNHFCIEFAHDQFVEYSRKGEIVNKKSYLKAIMFNSVYEGLSVKADANLKLFGSGRKSDPKVFDNTHKVI